MHVRHLSRGLQAASIGRSRRGAAAQRSAQAGARGCAQAVWHRRAARSRRGGSRPARTRQLLQQPLRSPACRDTRKQNTLAWSRR
jgi:hypothetical protein